MARKLHDNFNRRLAMLTMDLEALEQRAPLPVKELRGELGRLKERLAELCEDVRRMAYQLRPSALEHLGLAAALRSYCSEFTRHERIRAQFTCRGDDRAVPQDVVLCLYRVAQEALHNAARRSGSERVTVTLGETPREIRLEVADQGRRPRYSRAL
jgi:signal transduction histidine kinase